MLSNARKLSYCSLGSRYYVESWVRERAHRKCTSGFLLACCHLSCLSPQSQPMGPASVQNTAIKSSRYSESKYPIIPFCKGTATITCRIDIIEMEMGLARQIRMSVTSEEPSTDMHNLTSYLTGYRSGNAVRADLVRRSGPRDAKAREHAPHCRQAPTRLWPGCCGRMCCIAIFLR